MVSTDTQTHVSAPSRCLVCSAAFREVGRLPAAALIQHYPGAAEIVICGNCGSGTTLPVVDEAQIARFYESDEASDWSNFTTWESRGVVAFASRILQAARDRVKLSTLPFSTFKNSSGEVLDVGCGSGEIALFMQRQGWKVTGIEPDPGACRIAQSRGIDAHVGDLDTVEVGDESFDAAVLHHVLEHLADPVDTLSNVRSKLRPGGTLMVIVPNFGSWQRRVFGAKWFSLAVPHHRHHFTPGGLSATAERAGFVDVEVTTGVTSYPLLMSLEMAILGRNVARAGFSARLLDFATSFILTPLNVLACKITGRGDVVKLVARRPRSP